MATATPPPAARPRRPQPMASAAPAPAPAAAAPAPPPPADERGMSWTDLWGNLSKSMWTVIVWGLFLIVVLGPLLTVLLFSLTPSVFEGLRPSTLQWYRAILADPVLYYPLVRSFEIALIVVAGQLVLGTLIAYATVRRKVFGPGIMDAMSNLTIALPSVVIGLALLAFYSPYGPVSALSDLMYGNPLSLTFTMWIVVLAHVLETFPYMVRTVGSVLAQVPRNLESAAHSLGAGRFTVFRTVLLPQIKHSMLAGSVLVFSRSLAEFGATIVVVSAALKTAPVQIYSQESAGNLELAAAYSVILMLASLIIYLALRRASSTKGLAGLEMQAG
ncbi:MAG: sulfate/thiosulfate transport system permease protein [Thermoplasmata archaeon]|nr:sulfate/thiosulfate transport system permease protein [Thermoplasmata archaeon]